VRVNRIDLPNTYDLDDEQDHAMAGDRLKQYRARGYAAKRLQKRGVPLQVIMQVGGWKREAMPTRYIGKYDEGELQAFPTADLRSLLRGA